MKTTNYEQQALDFLNKTNTEFTAAFVKNGKHFEDDKYERDIYKITLTRGNRKFSFNFGQSLNKSGEYQVAEHLQNKMWCKQTTGGKICLNKEEYKKLLWLTGIEKDIIKNPNYSAPTAYDVLACLTKYDPGTLEDFCDECDECGYDLDSKKTEKVYNAVKDEYNNLCMLFSDEEIAQLIEIQ